MQLKKPRVASLDEIRISRDGESATISFIDASVATTHLTLGSDSKQLSDNEILDRFNEVISAQAAMAASYKHVAVEIPPGSPQVEFVERSGQWVPRGSVVRCQISDDEQGDVVIGIDDHELSLSEFGTLLTTYAGWGMRLVFVPDDETTKLPKIEVREPEHDKDSVV